MPLPLDEELDSLTAPLSGADPAGEPVPYNVREELDEARKEVNPDDYPPDYPGRPELKRADWAGLIRRCTKLLTGSSKDLMTAARLTEALTKEHGFAGTWSGLRLMRELVERAWDRMHPVVEDGDVEVRASPLSWLDDPVKGARFPTSLRSVPLAQGVGEKAYFTCLDWEKIKTFGEGMDQFDQGVLATPREEAQATFEAVDGAVKELAALSQALDARMGAAAPALLEVRKALEQCHLLARQIFDRKGPSPTTGEHVSAPAANGATEAGAAPRRAAAPAGESREELYASLAATAARLQRMEPHSPIPLLIQIAVGLGGLPFPQLMGALAKDQLMSALIRDPNILQDIGRAVANVPQ